MELGKSLLRISLFRLEYVFTQSANRANPILGYVLPRCAGSYSAVGVTDCRVINIAAGAFKLITQQQQEMVLVIGENIKVRRFAIFTEGVSVPYIHAGGKIGVLVNLTVEGGIDATAVGKDVAMQIAALNPRFWDKSQVSQDVLDEEKKIMMVQMENDPKMASKPEQVREKIVMGKMNKFYSENCLLQQEFVRGDVFTGSVEQYIADAAKKLGGKITFVDAIRFEKGEGIEKKQENFAEEIAKMVKG